RLLDIVKSDDTNDGTFQTAVSILIRGGPASYEVGEIFSGFITAKGKEDKWRAKNKAKRRWLLDTLKESSFVDDQGKSGCLELISSDAPKELKQPAITYLGTTKYQDALEKLRELAEGKELNDEALLAIAKIEPNAPVLTHWINEVTKIPSPPAETITTALKVSEVLKSDHDHARVLD